MYQAGGTIKDLPTAKVEQHDYIFTRNFEA